MYNILYVDDEPDLLEIGKLFLEGGGQFCVDILTSAFSGLADLASKNYDAIISDYQMPGMDGIEFLKKVRRSGSTIPFILFTGRGREEVVIQALNEGADYYLQKGGEPTAQFTELAHKVRQAVQQRQAEVKIRDHERREADILNFLPDATFAIDTHGVVIAWNRATEEMTGVSAAGMLGKGNYEYAIPFYGERIPVLIDMVFTYDDTIAQKYYQFLKKEGGHFIAESNPSHLRGKTAILWNKASPLYDNKGEIVGAIESIRDITERKRAEDALRESEEHLRTMIEQNPVSVQVMSPDGRTLQVNHAFEELWGGTLEDLKDYNMLEDEQLVRLGIMPYVKRGFSGEVITVPPVQYDNSGSWGPGVKIWVQSRIFPVRDAAGTIRTIIVVHDDITERKKVEDELLASEENFRTVVENAPDGIYIQTSNGFVYLNAKAVRLFGASSPEELLGTSGFDRIHPSFHELIRQRARTLTVDLKPVETINEIYLKMDGTPVDVEVAAVPFRYRGENGALIMFRDITRRKRAESELQAAYEQLAAIEVELRKKYRELTENIQKLHQGGAQKKGP